MASSPRSKEELYNYDGENPGLNWEGDSLTLGGLQDTSAVYLR